MPKTKFIKIIPLALVLALSVYLLLFVKLNNVVLQKSHIFGLIALGIVIAIQMINEKAGYYATFFMLTLGTFSILAFTPTIITFSIGTLKLDLFCLPILLIYLIIHRSLVASMLREFTKN